MRYSTALSLFNLLTVQGAISCVEDEFLSHERYSNFRKQPWEQHGWFQKRQGKKQPKLSILQIPTVQTSRVNILDWASRINVNVISLFISQVEAKQDFSGTAGATHSHHSHSKHSLYRSFCWCKKEHVYTFVLTLVLLALLLVFAFALADSISNVRCEALRAENETLKESCQTKCCCYFNAVRFATRQNIPATSESRLRRN